MSNYLNVNRSIFNFFYFKMYLSTRRYQPVTTIYVDSFLMTSHKTYTILNKCVGIIILKELSKAMIQ